MNDESGSLVVVALWGIGLIYIITRQVIRFTDEDELTTGKIALGIFTIVWRSILLTIGLFIGGVFLVGALSGKAAIAESATFGVIVSSLMCFALTE